MSIISQTREGSAVVRKPIGPGDLPRAVFRSLVEPYLTYREYARLAATNKEGLELCEWVLQKNRTLGFVVRNLPIIAINTSMITSFPRLLAYNFTYLPIVKFRDETDVEHVIEILDSYGFERTNSKNENALDDIAEDLCFGELEILEI